MSTQLAIRRFTVEEYHLMAKAGILTADDRVELIEGQIIRMTPIGSTHQFQVDLLAELFVRLLAGRAIIRVQGPIRLNDLSEPQPDLCLLRLRQDRYRQSHPGPADVLLVVEVSDTTLQYDRDVKMLLYARAGIGEAWLVDLAADRVMVYRLPSPDGYRETRAVGRGERLDLLDFPGVELLVDDILG
jgi:hypothetical protein